MKKKKIIEIIIATFILLFIVCGIFLSRLLYGGNYMVFNVTPETNLVAEAVAIQKTGGTLKLSDGDVNGILQTNIKNGVKKGDLKIKAVYSKLSKNLMYLYVPSSYKNINFLLTIEAKLKYKNGEIIVTPQKVSVGKINLSLNFVLGKFKHYLGNEMNIKGTNLIIKGSIIPFKITSFDFKDGFILTGIQKVNTQDINSGNASGSSGGSSLANKASIMKKAYGELGAVYSSVSTPNAKNVVASMQNLALQIANNPGGNYSAQSSGVKAGFNSLSPSEQSDVKNAITNHMDINTILQVKSLFGF